MTNEEVQQLVERLSLTYFSKPFQHQAYFNARLRTTGGRYLLQSHHIELNRKSYELYGEQELIGIILHELCHYHLHIEGKGYQHRDREFKELLKKVGAPRFCSSIQKPRRLKEAAYTYRCTQCNMSYERHRKMNVSAYVCGKCRGQLVEITHSKR